MTSYDSDSSSDGELDLQTNVTLGYATAESTGDDISHVGGHPTWLDQNTKPEASLSKCKACNSHMSLVLQLQADLHEQFPNDERRLFIWCCRKRRCTRKPGSVRVFREVKKAKRSKTKQKTTASIPNETPFLVQQPQNLGNQLFGASGSTGTTSNAVNPFSTTPQPSAAINPFSSASSSTTTQQNHLADELAAKSPQIPIQSFAEKLKISSPSSTPTKPPSDNPPTPEPWPLESSFPKPFPSFFLDAESEYLQPPSTAGPSTSTNNRITELEDEPSSSSSAAAEKDLYESPHDKTFDHFTRILAQNPEQILRYEFKGQPLLYSSTDAIAAHFVLPGHHLHHQQDGKVRTSGPVKEIPGCQHCGAPRVFEMQLVPYLIYELEKDDEEAMKLDGEEGMEWGTVIVGTCGRNCGDEEGGKVVFREEWAGVQWEEGGVELKARK